MKARLILVLALLAAAVSCSRDKSPLHLTKVMEVAGRQGVATDGTYYYVSGSTALYKYSLDGTLLGSNESPFETMAGAVNHIGDIDVHEGEIYAGCEYFMDGVGENIQVAVYDAETLRYLRSIPWNPESGQVECCGLAVDAARGHVWMADWVKGEFLYCYDLATSAYVGKVMLHPIPALQQGICSLGQGFVFNDLLTNYERVSDHCSNIAIAQIELQSDEYDTHDYVINLKELHSHNFDQFYEEYSEKYKI